MDSMVTLTILVKTLTSTHLNSLLSRTDHPDQLNTAKAALDYSTRTKLIIKSNIEGSQLSVTKTYNNSSNRLNNLSKLIKLIEKALVAVQEEPFSKKCKAPNLKNEFDYTVSLEILILALTLF